MPKLGHDNRERKRAQNNIGDAPVTSICADRDSNERANSQDTLRKNAELFQGIFNQAAVGIAITGPDRKVVQANQKICDFLGCQIEDLFGKTLRDATHPDFLDQVDEQIRKLVDGEVESATIENLYVRKDGSTVWGEWTSSLLRNEFGAPKYFISVIQNIDARKKADAESVKAKELLENSQRIANLGSWELDIAQGKERWSDGVYRVLGIEAGSVDFTGYGFMDFVHPDDRESTRSVKDHAIAKDEPYSAEYRIVRPDGAERVVCEYGELEYDKAGTPMRLVGTLQDVTEQRDAEGRVRETEEFSRVIFNQAAIGIAEISPKGRFVKFNQKLSQILGYPVDELGSLLVWEVTHPNDVGRHRLQFRRLMSGEISEYDLELRYVRADATISWCHVTFTAVHNASGVPLYAIALFEDIDNRKKAELALRYSNDRMEEAQRIASLGSWDWDPEENIEWWSDELYRIFGLAPRSSQMKGFDFLNFVHPDDLARVEETQKRAIEKTIPYSMQYRIIRQDGTERFLSEFGGVTFDARGKPKWRGITQDITEARQREMALRRTMNQLEEAQRLAHVGHWEWDPGTSESEWSEETFRIFGLKPGGTPPTHQDVLQDFLHEADRAALEQTMDDALRTGAAYTTEFRIVRPDGEVRTVFEHGERYVPEEAGRPRIRGVLQDITELKLAEGDLRELSRRLELAQKQAKVGYWRWSFAEERLTYWSPEAAKISRYKQEKGPLDYEKILSAIHPEDRLRVQAEFDAADLERRDYSVEYRIVDDEGQISHIREIGEVEYDESGVSVAHVGFVQDITELKQMEEELRKSEQWLNAFFEEAPAGLALYDREGRYIKVNETVARINCIPADAHIGKRPCEILPPVMARHIDEANRRTLETGAKMVNVELSAPLPTNPGEIGHYVYSRFPIPGPKGESIAVGVVVVDITERKRMENELRVREQELSQAQRIGAIGHWRLDLKNREFTYWSDELYRIFGVDKESFAPTFDRFLAAIHEDDLQASIENRKAAFAEKRPYIFEYRIVRPGGDVRVIHGEARPEFDEKGEATIVFGITQDVTEARQREAELRQAQKMEAVGQLTGGIAHDFNNLLAVITGNLELAQELADPGTEIGQLLKSVIGAADRGAALTQRLLAYSRKQPLKPLLVQVDTLVEHTLELLKRTLGATVEIKVISDDDLWACRVDPAQLESAIVNLAINARDAMPHGGKLTISTSNAQIDETSAAFETGITPGEYVLVAVSDTGLGMSTETMDHVFEPFFTTKDVGAGSGLGLSMVYGFVRQSGGHVTIYSEIEEGTTIRLYLPRHIGVSENNPECLHDDQVATANNEVVLVVEDNKDLRILVAQILQSLGYGVLEAGAGKAALDILEEVCTVDLLLTDLMIPGGISGRQLADMVRIQYPFIPVLYMSGYTQDAVVHQGCLEEGVQLLQKPFRKKDIARAVRRALDGQRV